MMTSSMSMTPTLQVPSIPASTIRPTSSGSMTPKTPKSMLRNLFSWKKTSNQEKGSPLSPSLPSLNDEIRPHTASGKQQQPPAITRKPSFSQRSRSENHVSQRSKSRSKSRRRSRSRARTVWDPPPLFHAYSQACMHDELQVPNKGILDWLPLNAASRASSKNSNLMEDERENIYMPSSGHKRSLSSSSTASLTRRLLFLFDNGHILQYKAEGSHDRLPERVIELSQESIAFASDAVAGKHWVLEICPHGRMQDEPSLPKSSWSRMTLKTPDTKRVSEKLLLVFDSPDSLFTWLIAIRKQIEGLGGMEYQPDMPVQLESDSRRPSLRHASSEYFKRKNGLLPFSRSSSALPMPSVDPDANKDLPQIPANFLSQRSTSARSVAASSVTTKTSLDRLRESYSGSSTAGTAVSSDISAASLSPTKDTFPPMLSPILSRDIKTHSTSDKHTFRSSTATRSFHEDQSSSPEPLPTPEVDQTVSSPTIPTIEIPESVDDSETKSIVTIIPLESKQDVPAPVEDRPTSIVAPLPVPELRRRLRQAQRTLSAGNADLAAQNRVLHAAGLERGHAAKLSINTSMKGSYGLFPKRLALDVKAEPLVVPDKDHVPGLSQTNATDHLQISESPITPVAAAFGSSLFARSNTAFKRPSPLALPHLLSSLDTEQPLRSPAVTDAMLASNFGTSFGGSATSPVTPIEIHVPNFSDIKVDKSLFEAVRVIEAQTTSPVSSPALRSITPRRSMPNVQFGSNNLMSAPAGPPPSGPLPAVPNIPDKPVSRSSTATSKRASGHSSNNRRGSTKSAGSTKAARHTQSTVSPSIPSIARMPSLKRQTPSPDHTRSKTHRPTPSASSIQKSQEIATTIGQLSIVTAPPPPRASSLPQHKKSLSTSSIKSNKSKKAHLRTASGKSISATIANFSTISHLVSPTCGLETDTDQLSRGCFGIGASRSSP